MHTALPDSILLHSKIRSSSKSQDLKGFFQDTNNKSKGKHIQRKTDSNLLNHSKSKKSIEQRNSSKYLPINPVVSEIYKTQVNDVLTKKITIRDHEGCHQGAWPAAPAKQHEDWTTYWRLKAMEYQQTNFNLQRLNSTLQQQIQILKHQNEKLQRKIERVSSDCTREEIEQKTYNLDLKKIEKYYQIKIEQFMKKLSEKDAIILKKDRKIRELCDNLADNGKLKNLLHQMEEKFSDGSSAPERSASRGSSKGRELLNLQTSLNRFQTSSNRFQLISPCQNRHKKNYIGEKRTNSLKNTYEDEEEQRCPE